MPSDALDKNLPPWTILKILNWTESYFRSFKIDSPRLAAEILLCHCLDIKRLDLYLQYDRPLDKKELAFCRELISRRVQREPVAYITGNKGFWESEFSVNPCVLIPRPDTEILVEICLEILDNSHKDKDAPVAQKQPVNKFNDSYFKFNDSYFKEALQEFHIRSKNKKLKILELGAGSGAVIISLAKTWPSNFYFAMDISPAAAEATACNALNILKKSKLFIFAGSWFSPLKRGQNFDLIVSNPPYIPSKEIDTLQPEIKKYEPRIALDGGEDGLDSIREIIAHAWKFLNPGGFLLLETGCDQKKNVEKIAKDYASYAFVKYIKDYSGHDRVAVLRKKSIKKEIAKRSGL